MISQAISNTAPDAGAIGRAVEILRLGGVVAYPTDTLYGLAVDPRSDIAARKLFDTKGREATVAVPLIAADVEQVEQAGRLGTVERRLAAAFWPGPLTLVLPAAPLVAPAIVAGGHTVAVRVPAHAVARALASAFGFCITSTSANLSGAAATADPAVVRATLAERVDLLLDGGSLRGGPPSTIVRIDHGRPTLVRAGAIAWERVLESLE
jgi:L-threonylcarbamoyladenylate synthase